MNGSIIATLPRGGQLRDRVGARAQRVGGGRVVEVDAQQHLAAVEAEARDRRRRVAGEAVVVLEDRVRPVPRGSSSRRRPCRRARPSSSRSSTMSGDPRTPSTPGNGQRGDETVEQVVAIAHRDRVVADVDDAARGVVGGEDEESVGAPRRARRRAGRRRRRIASGWWNRASDSTAALVVVHDRPPREYLVDLSDRGHGLRAGEARRDDRPGGAREAQRRREWPAGEHPVAE